MTVHVPDHALVLRGGDPHDPANLSRMIDQAQDSYDDGEGYALSTYVGVDDGRGSAETIKAIAAVRPIPNKRLAVTTAGHLRSLGCELEADGGLPGHVNVILGTNPDPKLVEKFINAFSPAVENPAATATRRRSTR